MTSIYVPITERFDELTMLQKVSLNFLINEVAKHQLSFEDDEQGKRQSDIEEALRVFKGTLEAKPERAIKWIKQSY